ncbi:ribosomal protein S18-alanine N-acetyltransferase [Leuconostocaceae bacterium ESL0723]|nr:ribosomal protein S18-alanine N-acetyltransferase [Leuconostocaceae bacterium ESL0723]
MFSKFKHPRRRPRQAFEAFEPYPIEAGEHRLLIRRALLADIPDLVKIQEAVYDGYAPWLSQDFLRELSSPRDRIYLVVAIDGQLVAFIGIVFRSQEEDLHISNLAVLPVWQGQGIGSELLLAAQRLAQSANLDRVSLEVRRSNEDAQRLYRRQGFEMTELVVAYYLDNQEDALSMRLTLENPPSNN